MKLDERISTSNTEEDVFSVSSDSSEMSEGEGLGGFFGFGRVGERAKQDDAKAFKGEKVLSPLVGHKTVLVTGGAGFIGSHVAGEKSFFKIFGCDNVVVVSSLALAPPR